MEYLLILLLFISHMHNFTRKLDIEAKGFTSLIIWTFAYLLFAFLLFFMSYSTLTFLIIGSIILMIGIIIRIVAKRELGDCYSEYIEKNKHSVIISDGIYKYCKHPLHLGLCFEISGLGITMLRSNPTLDIIILAVIMVTLITALIRNRNEEKYLTGHFGNLYRIYATGVRNSFFGKITFLIGF